MSCIKARFLLFRDFYHSPGPSVRMLFCRPSFLEKRMGSEGTLFVSFFSPSFLLRVWVYWRKRWLKMTVNECGIRQGSVITWSATWCVHRYFLNPIIGISTAVVWKMLVSTNGRGLARNKTVSRRYSMYIQLSDPDVPRRKGEIISKIKSLEAEALWSSLEVLQMSVPISIKFPRKYIPLIFVRLSFAASLWESKKNVFPKAFHQT